MGPDGRPKNTRPCALIVDHHKLFADLIRPLFEEQGIRVIGLARDGKRALVMVRDERPDLVLLNLGLPDEYGISVGRRIHAEFPRTKLIAITSFADYSAVRESVDAGFHACVNKDTPLSQFVTTIQSVLDGTTAAEGRPKPHKAVAGTSRNGGNGSRIPVELLTQREYEVLTLLAEGSSSREMADRLVLSPNTVRTHVQSVLTKLQVHSRIEAAAIAVRHGLGNG
jgi:two-component system, NarL family, nitrate/nitrite response regulator NarL